MFGAALGIILGIFCHFVIRDHLIGFFEKVIHWQTEGQGLLQETNKNSENPEIQVDDEEPSIVETGLEDVHEKMLSRKPKEDEKEFSPFLFTVYATLIWFAVIAAGTVFFIWWNFYLNKDNTQMVMWLNNLEKNCGAYKYEEAFHCKMFPGVGRVTFYVASMVIFSHRDKIGAQLCSNYKLQDGSNISATRRVAMYQVASRILCFSVLFTIYYMADVTAKDLEGDASPTLGQRFVAMFQTVIAPLLIIAYLLNSGVYDLMVSATQKYCITGTDEKF